MGHKNTTCVHVLHRGVGTASSLGNGNVLPSRGVFFSLSQKPVVFSHLHSAKGCVRNLIFWEGLRLSVWKRCLVVVSGLFTQGYTIHIAVGYPDCLWQIHLAIGLN